MNWADLFERAEAHRSDVETICQRLRAHREADSSREEHGDGEGSDEEDDEGDESNHA